MVRNVSLKQMQKSEDNYIQTLKKFINTLAIL